MIQAYKGIKPKLGKNVYIAETASVIGDVIIGDNVSVWPSAVLRGDMGSIVVGSNSNIQDGSVLHCMPGVPCVVGEYVTVGHLAHIHSATISDRVIIGSTSVVLDHAIVESDVIVGAGSLITPRKVMKSNHMIMGSPAQIKRELSKEEKEFILENAQEYVKLISDYLEK